MNNEQRQRVVCPKCHNYVKSENYSNHMSRVHGVSVRQKSILGKKTLITAFVLIAIIGVTLNFNSIFKDTSTNPEPQESTSINPTLQENTPTNPKPLSTVEPREINRPLSSVTTIARWFTYDSKGVDVKYFLVKGSDGKIHLGTDACYDCYEYKLGYRQNGEEMVCNKCSQTFPVNGIGLENLEMEGCWPSYIPFTINEDSIIIRMSDLDAKRSMFN
ncbi:Fe-S-containing protein [Thermoproteota archaeon]